jgi:hypothetical protein
MNEWRLRAQLRRRARRRYLAAAYERWRAAPARPTQHGRGSQVLLTLLWLVQSGPRPDEVRPGMAALLAPLLVVLVLRGSLRR